MPIQSFVGQDGTARVMIAGHETKLRVASVDHARERILELVQRHAAATGEIQHLVAHDPAGSWPMYVYPNGTITDAPRPIIAPPPVPEAYHDVQLPAEPQPAPEPPHTDAPVPEAYRDVQRDNIDRTILVPRVVERPTLLIHPESGVAVRVTPPVLLGRNPEERDGHTRVAVPSPGRECSRTHAVLDVDDECRIIVTDQDTPNGTLVDGTPIAPHTPTIVPNGARLQLGDSAARVEALPGKQTLSITDSATAISLAHHKEEAP